MKKISNDIINKFWCTGFVLYVILSLAYYGWYLVAFITSYSNLDDLIIEQRLHLWMGWHPTMLLLFTLTTIFAIIYRKKLIMLIFLNSAYYYQHSSIQIFVLLVSLLNYGLFQFIIHLHFVRLIGSVLVLWAIFLIGNQFFRSENIVWRHPTTIGSSFISSLLLGLSLVQLTNVFDDKISVPVFWFIVLILFDMFIFVARFRYLVSASQETNRLVKFLMGPLLLYTGIRIIVGIFMPLVYAFYMMYSGQDHGKGIAVMIIFGVFLDRMLTICAANRFSS